MHILIVEPEIKGHHIILYVRLLAKELKKKNIHFSLLTSRSIIKTSVYKLLKKEIKKLKFFFMDELQYPKKPSTLRLFFFQIKNFFLIKQTFQKINLQNKITHVFMSNFEIIDKAMIFLGSPFGNKNFSGILLNPQIHMLKRIHFLKRWKFFFYNKFLESIFQNINFKNLFTNDILFYNYFCKHYSEFKKKIFLYREPSDLKIITSKKISKSKFNLNQNHFIILVFGAMKSSKGILDLLDIFNDNNLSSRIKVFLVGEQTTELRKLLNNIDIVDLIKNKKLFIFDRFISIQEQEKFFSAADLVWLAYSKSAFGSSGVLSLAMKAKIPIITSNTGLISWINNKYELGYVITKKNLVQIINRLSLKKKDYKKFISNQKFFLKDKKFNKFEKIIIKKIIN